MPRRNRNARPRLKKPLKIEQPKAVLMPIRKKRDGISPGYLVAAAKWKEVQI